MSQIAVFISGGGTNLQALIDAGIEKKLAATIAFVASDRPCLGIKRAIDAKIPAFTFSRDQFFQSVESLLTIHDVDYIVLAGFLSIVESAFISKWERQIINIHPSLLPKYGGKGMYGIHVQEAVIQNQEQESGCTVHFVDHGIDTGEIILQKKLALKEISSASELQKRVLELEHKALVEAINSVVGGKIK